MTFLAQLGGEWRLLARSRAALATFGLLALLLGAGVLTSLGAVARRWREVEAARAEEGARLSKLRSDVAAIERGGARPEKEWKDPTGAGFWLDGAARVVAREPAPLAALAPGTLERERPVALVRGVRPWQPLEGEPLRLPRRFAEGSIELGAVLVWLLPLLVIALTFDATSRERERGALPLALSQGVSPAQFLAAKVAAGAPPVASAAAAAVAATALAARQLDGLALALAVAGVVAYVGVWAGLAAWVNTWGRASGTNAIALLGLWLLAAVALPLGASAARVAFAAPSQTEAVVAARAAAVPVRTGGSPMLKRYYEDHPELARGGPDVSDFTKKYVLVEDRVAQELAPLQARHERALAAHQASVERLTWLSPSLPLASLLDALAGSGPSAARAFRADVAHAYDGLRTLVLPRLYAGTPMAAADVDALPAVRSTPARGVDAGAYTRVAFLAALAAGLGALAARRARKGSL